jgi:hypothetical protein
VEQKQWELQEEKELEVELYSLFLFDKKKPK